MQNIQDPFTSLRSFKNIDSLVKLQDYLSSPQQEIELTILIKLLAEELNRPGILALLNSGQDLTDAQLALVIELFRKTTTEYEDKAFKVEVVSVAAEHKKAGYRTLAAHYDCFQRDMRGFVSMKSSLWHTLEYHRVNNTSRSLWRIAGHQRSTPFVKATVSLMLCRQGHVDVSSHLMDSAFQGLSDAPPYDYSSLNIQKELGSLRAQLLMFKGSFTPQEDGTCSEVEQSAILSHYAYYVCLALKINLAKYANVDIDDEVASILKDAREPFPYNLLPMLSDLPSAYQKELVESYVREEVVSRFLSLGD